MTIVLRIPLIACLAATLLAPSGASAGERHGRVRPLTITPHAGLYRQGDTIVARGGFSAHGYGYPPATRADRRAAYNAHLRDLGTLYGTRAGDFGVGFDDDRGSGYANPSYGNAFSSYVGYNGVPTNLAFGPGFANRRAANHDPDDDEEAPGPSPSDLGYGLDQ